jgi:predicted amidohydrolase YtcJ
MALILSETLSQADALSFISTAATRVIYQEGSKVLGPDQSVSMEAASAGVVTNPTKQILFGHEIGSLEMGKYANFGILAEDIYAPTVIARTSTTNGRRKHGTKV